MINMLRRYSSSAQFCRFVALSSFIYLTLSLSPIHAQMPDISTEHVKIDLSVINNSGLEISSSPNFGNQRVIKPKRDLMLPGSSAPISTLHIIVPNSSKKIKLKKLGKNSLKLKKKFVGKAVKNVRARNTEIVKPKKPDITAITRPVPLIAKIPPVKIAPPISLKQKTSKEAIKNSVTPVLVKKVPKPPEIAPPPVKKLVSKKTKSKPKKAPINKEKASLKPGDKIIGNNKVIRINFDAKSSKFPKKAKKDLQNLAKKLKGKDNSRLQLMAYAGGKSISSSKARRLSLSRALSVRSFLIESGVKSTRIDVRALGSKTTEKPINRVDVNIIER